MGGNVCGGGWGAGWDTGDLRRRGRYRGAVESRKPKLSLVGSAGGGDVLLAGIAALIGGVAWAELPALRDEARAAAERFAPGAVLIELRVEPEGSGGELTWTFFDGEGDEAKDLFVDVTLRGGAPTVRLAREPKREPRPAPLDLSRATV